MPRFKVSFLAACGLLILAAVLGTIGPKRALAALGYTPVREVNAPGRQPFGITLDVSNSASFAVPTGKRLILTHLDSVKTNGGGQSVSVSMTTNGSPTYTVAPYVTRGPDDFVTQQLMVSADPGTTVAVSYAGQFSLGDSVTASLHGYFLDAP